MVGLGSMSVLDAAAVDGEDIPWCIAGVVVPGALSGLIALMQRCLDSDPAGRPSLNNVQTALNAIPQ